jgi:UDP-N-acetyl-D-mannosaminuronate dehydrogenase
MSWLAKELDMKYDFCKFMMTTREKQTEFIADKLAKLQKEYNIPIMLLGKSFKANIALTTGSFAVLLSNLLTEKEIAHTAFDPLIDETNDFSNTPRIYCLSTQHDIFRTILTQVPKGSVVVDLFRYYKDVIPKDVTYIPIGIGPKE